MVPKTLFMLKSFLYLLSSLILFSQNTLAQGWLWGKDSRINSNGVEEGGPVAIDNLGNVYGINAVGSLLFAPGIITSRYGSYSVTDSLDFSQSVIYSLDDSGNYRWAVGTYGGVQLNNIFTDDGDNVYLSGHKNASMGYFAGLSFTGTSSEDFIVKLNSAGHGIWFKVLPAGIDLNSIAVSHSGDIYFTGDLTITPITFGTSTITTHNDIDVIIGKYDSSGSQQWAISFGGNSVDAGTSITLTEGGVLYVAGTSSSSSLVLGNDTLADTAAPGNAFFFVCKIDTGKHIEWGRSIIHSPDGGSISGISAGNMEHLYCSGGYYTSMHSGSVSLPAGISSVARMFLFRFDSSGQLKWGRTIIDTLTFSSTGVDADYCGNIWVAGQGGHRHMLYDDPMYLARFDTAGNLKDTIFLASGGDDANWLKLDKRGYLYVSGDYQRNPFLPEDVILDSVGSDEALFVGKYIYALSECMLDTFPLHHIKTITEHVISKEPSVILYPNPAAEKVTIHSDDAFTRNDKAELYDLTSRLINSYPLFGNNTEISTANLTPGMYQCRIYSTGNSPITKKLVIMK